MSALKANPLSALLLSAAVASTMLAAGLLPVAARAQSPDPMDRPGIEHYPAWMLESAPRISGQEQDYRVWEDDRFDRLDADFLAWRNEQRRKYGPDWRSRPGYEEDLRDWLDERR